MYSMYKALSRSSRGESGTHRVKGLALRLYKHIRTYPNMNLLKAVTTFLKVSSQAYILISLIPKTTSFITFTLLSVIVADLNLKIYMYNVNKVHAYNYVVSVRHNTCTMINQIRLEEIMYNIFHCKKLIIFEQTIS